jgi:glutamyl-tRNA synthetase
MLNYLALLGWNPKTDQEFFSHEELVSLFSLAGVQKGGAIFSEEKLQAVNKYYLRKLAPADLLEQAKPFLEQAGYAIGGEDSKKYWAGAVACEQERVATLAELPEKVIYFKPDWPGDYPAELLVWKKSSPAATSDILTKLQVFLSELPDEQYAEEHLEKNLLAWIEETGAGKGDVLWPLRVAMTGLANSPGPFEVGAVLGKAEVLSRLNAALAKLS